MDMTCSVLTVWDPILFILFTFAVYLMMVTVTETCSSILYIIEYIVVFLPNDISVGRLG